MVLFLGNGIMHTNFYITKNNNQIINEYPTHNIIYQGRKFVLKNNFICNSLTAFFF
jgi:hypothetical protein